MSDSAAVPTIYLTFADPANPLIQMRVKMFSSGVQVEYTYKIRGPRIVKQTHH
jgi:hypothetical protein